MSSAKTFFSFIIVTVIFLFGCKKENPVQQQSDEQFLQVKYEYGLKDEVNTFDGYIQKDLVADGTIKVKFWFTTAEQDSILKVINEIQFFSLPDTIHKNSNVIIMPDLSPDYITINYNSQEKKVVYYFPSSDSLASERIGKLVSKLQNLIQENNIYKNLPPANGGYH